MDDVDEGVVRFEQVQQRQLQLIASKRRSGDVVSARRRRVVFVVVGTTEEDGTRRTRIATGRMASPENEYMKIAGKRKSQEVCFFFFNLFYNSTLYRLVGIPSSRETS